MSARDGDRRRGIDHRLIAAGRLRAPGGWVGVSLAWDVLADLDPLFRPPDPSWGWASLWLGPEGAIRCARGSGTEPECRAEAGILPGDGAEGFGAVLAILGYPVGAAVVSGPPSGWAGRAFAESGIELPDLAADAFAPLGLRDFSVPEYRALREDGSGRLAEMASTYPVLTPFLSGPVGSAYRSGGVPAAARALSRLLGATVPAALLRRLRGVSVDGFPDGDVAEGLRLLGGFPIDLCPRSREGFESAMAIAHARSMLPEGGFLGAPASPEAHVRRLLKALDIKPSRRGGLDLATIRDLPGHADRIVEELARDVVGPALRQRGIPGDALAEARSAFLGGLSLPEAAQAMLRREKGRAAQERGMPRGRGFDAPWPRPCEDFETPSGLRVVPVLSWRGLVEEGDPGRGLDHCVGNAAYARACSEGTSVILSIRSAQGARLATAEIQEAGASLRVVQVRGTADADPSAEVRGALDHWLSAWSSGRLDVAFETFPLDLDYDRDDPASVEQALAAWRPLLAGTTGAWAEAPPVRTP
jgi:hypothetical protein